MTKERSLLLVPLALLFACSSFSFNDLIPNRSGTRVYTHKKDETTKPTSSDSANIFNTNFKHALSATLEGVIWLKWEPVYINEDDGVIILKESYVYKRDGRLNRRFSWPPANIYNHSDINDYLKRIGEYNTFSYNQKPLFSQERMKIKLKQLSTHKIKIDIEYQIKPFLASGHFGDELLSNGYIEQQLLDKIREEITGLTKDTS